MSRGRNRRGEPVNGVLLLDKQKGITSNKALQQCRYLINAQKGGHTGALDPLATGLLPLCFGQATKVSSFLLDSDKTYAVSIKLGEITDTGDADGKVIDKQSVSVSKQDVKSAIEQFIGEYDQVPPMYSALKVNGQPLYKLARQGIEIERKARRVTAHDIRFCAFNSDTLSFEVDCSSGFYVRSLSEDIGRTLGCGAHVKTLRRLRIGKLSVKDALTFGEFETCASNEARIAKLIPADLMLDKFPVVSLDSEQSAELKHGRAVNLVENTLREAQWVRVYGLENVFLGLGQINAERQLAPKRLFI
jgi:tRNA pseudouridine55 synthase